MKLNPLRRVMLPVLAIAAGVGAGAAGPAPILLPSARAFPESLTSTKDGTIYVPSLAEGGIMRVRKGVAEPFIAPGAFGSRSIYGVFADEKSGILWACSNDLARFGGTTAGDPGNSIKGFDLKTGEGKISAAFPAGRAECNDFAIGPDGSVYVSDTGQPRVLKLAKGDTVLKVWLTDPRFDQKGSDTDGIAFGSDGQLYVDTLGGSHLFRVAVNGDMPGAVTELTTSQPIIGADALRHLIGNTFLMIEAGKLDQVVVDGDKATITTLRDGLEEPTGVAVVGKTAWVSEGRLSFVFDKAKRTQTPPAFHLQPIPLPK